MTATGGEPPRPAGRGRRLAAVLAVAVAVVAADQWTKDLAVHRLAAGPVHVVGPVSLALAYNTGMAFSIGSGYTVPIVIAAGALAGVVLVLARGAPGFGAAAAFGLVLGGAVGNLSDRLFRGHSGAVVDFVRIGLWPTFNLADASIVCGCALLLLGTWRHAPRDCDGDGPGHASEAPGGREKVDHERRGEPGVSRSGEAR
ncbi:MAG: signal peptidase II [Actinomycetota bacterium]|nr:signal peptidase II [Actinomycetota bacterium]